jgi:hypothetical protein
MTTLATIGEPFRCEELEAAEVLPVARLLHRMRERPTVERRRCHASSAGATGRSEPPADHADDAARAWEFVCRLPRAGGD